MTRSGDSQQKTEKLAILEDQRIKLKRSKKRDKYQDLAREIKKIIECKGYNNINSNRSAWNSPQRIGKGTGRLENKRISGNHSNYSIIKINQNTEKNPGELRRLAVTQTPVENHQLMLLWKTLKEVIIMIKKNLVES